jgi:hypothetical protein
MSVCMSVFFYLSLSVSISQIPFCTISFCVFFSVAWASKIPLPPSPNFFSNRMPLHKNHTGLLHRILVACSRRCLVPGLPQSLLPLLSIFFSSSAFFSDFFSIRFFLWRYPWHQHIGHHLVCPVLLFHSICCNLSVCLSICQFVCLTHTFTYRIYTCIYKYIQHTRYVCTCIYHVYRLCRTLCKVGLSEREIGRQPSSESWCSSWFLSMVCRTRKSNMIFSGRWWWE